MSDPTPLLERIQQGDSEALADLFTLYQERLWRMIQIRLDRRLSKRLDPADILQEAFLDVSKRIGEYLADQSVPIYLWMRTLVHQRMIMLHRQHMDAQMRSVRQEVPLYYPEGLQTDSGSLAGHLVGHLTSPSQAAIKQERQNRIQEVLDQMEDLDKEVLALRHFEELSNAEIAQVLNITPSAASKRYLRALEKLKDLLVDESDHI